MRKMAQMRRFPVSVPVDLHRAFKMKCVSEGRLMSEVVRGLLERELEARPQTAKKPAHSAPRPEINA